MGPYALQPSLLALTSSRDENANKVGIAQRSVELARHRADLAEAAMGCKFLKVLLQTGLAPTVGGGGGAGRGKGAESSISVGWKHKRGFGFGLFRDRHLPT